MWGFGGVGNYIFKDVYSVGQRSRGVATPAKSPRTGGLSLVACPLQALVAWTLHSQVPRWPKPNPSIISIILPGAETQGMHGWKRTVGVRTAVESGGRQEATCTSSRCWWAGARACSGPPCGGGRPWTRGCGTTEASSPQKASLLGSARTFACSRWAASGSTGCPT